MGTLDGANDIQNLLAHLGEGREAESSEIQVLQSIYGDDSVKLWHPSPSKALHYHPTDEGKDVLRYTVSLALPDHDDVSLKILVSLPPSYPASSAPQLQLLSRYIGAFGVDTDLFSSVLRTFISQNGVQWSPDNVCVFDGLESVMERCTRWYESHLSAELAGELAREDEKETSVALQPSEEAPAVQAYLPAADHSALLRDVQIFETEPIIDRKSVFIGRACAITDPSQVPRILSYLMSDRRISRAAHPIINAWRCQSGSVLHQDNDDDGETAAGGRLAHLLQILEVNNVLVVVTRYFGGIHLGADRFKHINQAARNALELGKFLDNPEAEKRPQGRVKRH